MSSDGLIVVDKPAGLTSHDVVARLRRLAGTRRVGHAGTLDPMATGVLVCGIGKATKILGKIAATNKEYDATIRLGVSTITDDAQGEVVEVTDAGHVLADEASLRQAVAELTGNILQRPSSVSAIKIDGKRAYHRVRAGESVAIPERPVEVTEFEVISAVVVELAGGTTAVDLQVHVACSTGTYIRALARDLGSSLGVGGHLTMLRRTRVGSFGIDQAATLPELEQELRLQPLSTVCRTLFPAVVLAADEAEKVGHGGRLPWPEQVDPQATVAMFGEDEAVLGLAEKKGEQLAPVVVWATR